MNIIKARPSFQTLPLTALLFVCTSSLYLFFHLYPITTKPSLPIAQQQKAININSNLFKIFSLGQSRLGAGILWVETLLNSDLDHYEKGDLNDWMYLRFNTITDLDPYFYEAYLYGGIYLSIIKDDEEAARLIYEKGIKQYPDDFYLLLNASFHYYYELGDIDRSLDLLSKIYAHPKAPSFLPSLYARMKSTRGDLESALALVISLYHNSAEGSPQQDSYAHKAYALKAELDLKCLNSSSSKGCNHKDFFGNDYRKNGDGIFEAAEKWEPFRIIKAPTKQ